MLDCKRNTVAEPFFDIPKVRFHRYSRQVVVEKDGSRSFKVSISDKPFVPRGFHSSDFSLSAILSAGATNLLTPQYPLVPSLDYVESVVVASESNDA